MHQADGDIRARAPRAALFVGLCILATCLYGACGEFSETGSASAFAEDDAPAAAAAHATFDGVGSGGGSGSAGNGDDGGETSGDDDSDADSDADTDGDADNDNDDSDGTDGDAEDNGGSDSDDGEGGGDSEDDSGSRDSDDTDEDVDADTDDARTDDGEGMGSCEISADFAEGWPQQAATRFVDRTTFPSNMFDNVTYRAKLTDLPDAHRCEDYGFVYATFDSSVKPLSVQGIASQWHTCKPVACGTRRCCRCEDTRIGWDPQRGPVGQWGNDDRERERINKLILRNASRKTGTAPSALAVSIVHRPTRKHVCAKPLQVDLCLQLRGPHVPAGKGNSAVAYAWSNKAQDQHGFKVWQVGWSSANKLIADVDPFASYKDAFAFAADLRIYNEDKELPMVRHPGDGVVAKAHLNSCSAQPRMHGKKGKTWMHIGDARAAKHQAWAWSGSHLSYVRATRATWRTHAHEWGHMFCELMDEYDVDPGPHWERRLRLRRNCQGRPDFFFGCSEPNVKARDDGSRYDAGWEGCTVYPPYRAGRKGAYRPTHRSLMSFGTQFNVVGLGYCTREISAIVHNIARPTGNMTKWWSNIDKLNPAGKFVPLSRPERCKPVPDDVWRRSRP